MGQFLQLKSFYQLYLNLSLMPLLTSNHLSPDLVSILHGIYAKCQIYNGAVLGVFCVVCSNRRFCFPLSSNTFWEAKQQKGKPQVTWRGSDLQQKQLVFVLLPMVVWYIDQLLKHLISLQDCTVKHLLECIWLHKGERWIIWIRRFCLFLLFCLF